METSKESEEEPDVDALALRFEAQMKVFNRKFKDKRVDSIEQ